MESASCSVLPCDQHPGRPGQGTLAYSRKPATCWLANSQPKPSPSKKEDNKGVDPRKPTIEERLEALAMNLELQARQTESLNQILGSVMRITQENARQSQENIRAIAELRTIVESHERRLERLER